MTIDKLIGDLQQHLASRKLRETAQEQENRYKARLLDDLVEAGEETPEGHYVLSFDGEAYERGGLVLGDGRVVRSVKREKRAPLRLDPDEVNKLLSDEHRERVFKTTVVIPDLRPKDEARLMKALEEMGLFAGSESEQVIDEDELLSLNYEEEISDADLKKMYVEPEKPVFALKVSYAKS